MSTLTIKSRIAIAAVCTALSLLPTTAMATNGYFSHGYGIISKGMAGAGVASPQNAMIAATNPSGMAYVGNRFDFGLERFAPDRSSVTRSDSISYDGNGDSSFFIPEFAYNAQISPDKTLGVVVYGNGGMNTTYPTIPQYAGATSFKTGVDLAQLFIAPTFSFKASPKHSLGASLNFVYQRFEANGIAGFCGFKATPCGDGGASAASRAGLSDQGTDSSTGYSLKLGWTGQLADNFTAAAAYQMKTDMTEFDKYNQLFAEQGDFDIPSHWTLGLAYQATPALNIVFDVQQINYTDIASVSNVNVSGVSGALGADNGRGFGWDDMTVYKLGAQFDMNDKLVLRAGYSITDQPIGADDTSFNLIAPGVIEEHFTAGMTYQLANDAELSAFLMYAPEVTVNGNTNTPGTNGAANLSMSQNSMGIAYGWQF